ncbi:uncharacterized protein CLUP02_05685 [Colletotrichum lupini]|uniref:Uncharacterized protein n=1 Tax=Colletotrichum lupini TaxID=145971 RepID=A0A9Q8SMY6_9PEZI|nr:uncharacterized protein CLUP02_05685 [Colletotrichum lupini]UQC80203.1 hypothetical protein CLUP02_05685 [Colletotrichum lupini]
MRESLLGSEIFVMAFHYPGWMQQVKGLEAVPCKIVGRLQVELGPGDYVFQKLKTNDLSQIPREKAAICATSQKAPHKCDPIRSQSFRQFFPKLLAPTPVSKSISERKLTKRNRPTKPSTPVHDNDLAMPQRLHQRT